MAVEKKKLNNLIPMQMPDDAGATFVNQWDVADRKADGWKVIGDERKHVSQVAAPVAELRKKPEAKKAKAESKAG